MQILKTKLNRPSVAPDIVPRQRLLEKLDVSRKGPLTLISAPAGYGKSTLASLWVEACDCPTGWVSLDENDNDLRHFLQYIIVAIQTMFPKTQLRTEDVLAAQQLPGTAELARLLLNDLHGLSAPFIIILDDYHRIEELGIHDLVATLLSHPAEVMHLVLVTRQDPPLPIATLRGRGQVTEIRAGDLRFTPSEAAAFLTNMLHVEVAESTAVLLDKQIEGWPTGVRLAGLSLQDCKDLKVQIRKLGGNSRHITEFLIAEVLAKQTPEMTSRLLETAVLDRFCAPLCRSVWSKNMEAAGKKQNPEADEFIQWLVETNMFVIGLDHQGYWFRYHHLFQQFLQQMLQSRAHPEAINRLHLNASQWFARNGLTEEAIRHALAAGKTDVAVGLVADRRYEMLNTSCFDVLERWLGMLPDEAIADTPALLTAKAFVCIEQGRDMDVYNCTDQANHLLDRFPPETEEYAILKSEVNVLISFIGMVTGDYENALARSEETVKADSLPEEAWFIRFFLVSSLALSHQMAGNIKEAEKVLGDSLSNPAWPVNLRGRLQFGILVAHYMDADLDKAVVSARACLRTVQVLDISRIRFFARYMLGAIHYVRNEMSAAEPYLQSVLDDYLAGNPNYVCQAAFILACIHIARNRVGQAEQLLDRIGSHYQKSGAATVHTLIQAFQVELCLRWGNIDRARQKHHTAEYDMRPPLWFFYVPQLTPAKILLADSTKESLKEAHAMLVELEHQMSRQNRKSALIDVLTVLALVCHQQGDEAGAIRKLQDALTLAETGGWVRNFIDLGVPMKDLLKHLLEAQPDHSFARKVLADFPQDVRPTSATQENADMVPEKGENKTVFVLTRRESELLPLLAKGLSNKEIAHRLHVSTETVKTHLQNIYGKLSTRGRVKVVNKALALGILKTGAGEKALPRK